MKLNLARGLGQAALDIAFPPACPACREAVDAQGNFCGECFSKLKLIAKPLCKSCGIPFAFDVGPDAQCPDCLSEPPAFDAARSVMVYDAVSAPLVSSLKFHDQWSGLQRYVSMMASAGEGFAVDAIVPVPLHWRRLWRRRYNQSALLGFGLAKQLGKPCLPQLLKRVVYTKPQMRLSREERRKNVKGAFAVADTAKDFVQGKSLLLVDDVVTTGATVHVCAAALKQAGAKHVYVLSLARTVKE